MSILRIKGVKFVNRQHLKDQKQILFPNEYYEKLIGVINTPTKVTLAFKCGRRWKMYRGFIYSQTESNFRSEFQTKWSWLTIEK